ncbi:hypothetical protein, partial [Frankia sp. Cr1]|uniref:hypothetical protein n=1 Tax=Frankia sp. Cr1 TaxID=3073931 RepID=UPI002AD4ECBC
IRRLLLPFSENDILAPVRLECQRGGPFVAWISQTDPEIVRPFSPADALSGSAFVGGFVPGGRDAL